MKAAELYAKTLQGYSLIHPVLKVSLSSYCKDHRIYYRGFRQWMRENAIPVPKSQKQMPPSLPVPSFAPVTILAPPFPDKQPFNPSPAGMLRGVQIKLPNGLHVSIREISGRDMTFLIEKINPR
jgi:hypothetical protein